MSTKPLQGKPFVLTGKGLKYVRRSDVEMRISQAGGGVYPNVSKHTTFLLTGQGGKSSGTAKHKDADSLGVPKVDVDEFLDWLDNPSSVSTAVRNQIEARITAPVADPSQSPPKATVGEKRKREKQAKTLYSNIAKLAADDGVLVDF